jgi:hypothetical protein
MQVYLLIHTGNITTWCMEHTGLVSNDKENCGVIVDKLDQGIDTGEIITQTRNF